ncbi:uncharacterized protein [Palaemon carinicauda]|uniref:uncharacterized protein n=1 Tax=Palaemon carinicauda TaxID=392227 RepID=UPI0035B6A907
MSEGIHFVFTIAVELLLVKSRRQDPEAVHPAVPRLRNRIVMRDKARRGEFPGHIFYGHRNAALETQDHTPWVAPNDAEGSDVNVSPLDVDSDDDDPTYVPDEGLTQEDAFDPPNARARRVNVVVPQEMPVEEEVEGEVNPKRPCVVEWKKDDIHIQALPDFIHPQPDFLREPYEDFRLDISNWLRSFKTSNFKITRNSLDSRDVALPKRGQRAVVPSVELRQDAPTLHMPKHVTMRQTCKFCSTAGHIHRSRWMCEECKVALCLTENRNCFALFHKISK